MTSKDLLTYTKTGWFMAAWLATCLLASTWADSAALANTIGTIVTVGAWLVWARVLILRVGARDAED